MRIRVLYLIIIITKSEVWTISRCLGKQRYALFAYVLNMLIGNVNEEPPTYKMQIHLYAYACHTFSKCGSSKWKTDEKKENPFYWGTKSYKLICVDKSAGKHVFHWSNEYYPTSKTGLGLLDTNKYLDGPILFRLCDQFLLLVRPNYLQDIDEGSCNPLEQSLMAICTRCSFETLKTIFTGAWLFRES